MWGQSARAASTPKASISTTKQVILAILIFILQRTMVPVCRTESSQELNRRKHPSTIQDKQKYAEVRQRLPRPA